MAVTRSWEPPTAIDELRLVRVLGEGATGQVWLAHDTVLDRACAVKLVSAAASSPTVRERFVTEARAIARLQHPNVVAIYRIGEIETRPYLVSEYVRGQGLDRIDKPLPPGRVLEIGLGLARGLGAAHRAGVLHRDIKPANVVLAEDGQVK